MRRSSSVGGVGFDGRDADLTRDLRGLHDVLKELRDDVLRRSASAKRGVAAAAAVESAHATAAAAPAPAPPPRPNVHTDDEVPLTKAELQDLREQALLMKRHVLKEAAEIRRVIGVLRAKLVVLHEEAIMHTLADVDVMATDQEIIEVPVSQLQLELAECMDLLCKIVTGETRRVQWAVQLEGIKRSQLIRYTEDSCSFASQLRLFISETSAATWLDRLHNIVVQHQKLVIATCIGIGLLTVLLLDLKWTKPLWEQAKGLETFRKDARNMVIAAIDQAGVALAGIRSRIAAGMTPLDAADSQMTALTRAAKMDQRETVAQLSNQLRPMYSKLSTLIRSEVVAGVVSTTVAFGVVVGVTKAGQSMRVVLQSKFYRTLAPIEHITLDEFRGDIAEVSAIRRQLEVSYGHLQSYLEFASETEQPRVCPICLEAFKPTDDLVCSNYPSCGRFHQYHRACIGDKVHQCAVCRRTVLRWNSYEPFSPFVRSSPKQQAMLLLH